MSHRKRAGASDTSTLIHAILVAAGAGACGPPPRLEALLASPDAVTLLGPLHGRTLEVYGREPSGAWVRVEPEELVITSEPAGIVEAYGARLRARAPGRARVELAAGGAGLTLEVEVLELPAPFAQEVLAVERGEGDGYGRDALPGVVLGPPRGGGAYQGGTDVLSLGLAGSITLSLAPLAAYDGPGPDLIVFENPFRISTGGTFTEPAEVAFALEEGELRAHPCAAGVEGHAGCAGLQPVLAGPFAPQLDPSDPTEAGGDPFDLASVSLPAADRARITDAATSTITTPTSGFDLDGLAIVHVLPPGVIGLSSPASLVSLRSGDVATLPRFDLDLREGGAIRGVPVIVELQPGAVVLEGSLLRAVSPGRGVVSARAGSFTARIELEVLP